LLADVAALISTGQVFPRQPQPSTDDETRKRITAIAIAGYPAVLLDNLTGRLGYPSLDAALTCGGMWSDRILGESTHGAWPLRTVWWATGNNVALGGDTIRRTLHVRLNSNLERPEDRSDLRYANLRSWIRTHRPRLVRACLVVLKAYYVAGRPVDAALPAWGSYEPWSDLIRQCVVWLGLPDPAAGREELRSRADVDRGAVATIIELLARLTSAGNGIPAAKLLEEAGRCEDLLSALCELLPPKDSESLPNARRVGAKLRQLRERIIDGRYVDAVQDRTGSALWLVRSAAAGFAGGAGHDSTRAKSRTGDHQDNGNF
jgi:hypothetical protein